MILDALGGAFPPSGGGLSPVQALSLAKPSFLVGRDRSFNLYGQGITRNFNGDERSECVQVPWILGHDAGYVRFWYANVVSAGVGDGTIDLVAPGPNPITVRSSLQIPSETSAIEDRNGWYDHGGPNAGYILPNDARVRSIRDRWGNADSIVLQPGQTAPTEWIKLPNTIYKGRQIYSRSYVEVAAAGMKWPTPVTPGFGPYYTGSANRGAGLQADATGVVTAIPGGNSFGDNSFGPLWVEIMPPDGQPWDSPVRVFDVGDSRLSHGIQIPGYFSISASWLGAALNDLGVMWIEYGLQSSLRAQYGRVSNDHKDRAMSLATDVFDCFGQNDLQRTLEQMQGDVIAMSRRVRGLGARYHVATVYPQTTDGSNATPSGHAARVAYNDWLRSLTPGKGSPIDGLLDSSDALAAAGPNTPVRARNGPYFVTPDGATSYDGFLADAGSVAGDGVHTTDKGKEILRAYARGKLPALLGL